MGGASSERNKAIFSKNLDRLLKEHNVKKIELANYLDIPKSNITNYLKQTCYPRMERIQKIASYFGTTIDSLTKEEGNTTLNEKPTKLTSSIPLLSNRGDLLDNIFDSKNYIDFMSLPYHHEKDAQYYAIKISDNDMKGYNLTKGNVAVFMKGKDAKNHEFVAVYDKDTEKIIVRSISKRGNSITLISDSSSLKADEKKFVILGKVVSVMSMF